MLRGRGAVSGISANINSFQERGHADKVLPISDCQLPIEEDRNARPIKHTGTIGPDNLRDQLLDQIKLN
jgi:hypothetical protein